jgi:hypothetical protein
MGGIQGGENGTPTLPARTGTPDGAAGTAGPGRGTNAPISPVSHPGTPPARSPAQSPAAQTQAPRPGGTPGSDGTADADTAEQMSALRRREESRRKAQEDAARVQQAEREAAREAERMARAERQRETRRQADARAAAGTAARSPAALQPGDAPVPKTPPAAKPVPRQDTDWGTDAARRPAAQALGDPAPAKSGPAKAGPAKAPPAKTAPARDASGKAASAKREPGKQPPARMPASETPPQAAPRPAPRPAWTAEEHNSLRREAEALTTTYDYSLYLENGRSALQADGARAAAELREIARLHSQQIGRDHPSAQRLETATELVIAEVLGPQPRPGTDPDTSSGLGPDAGQTYRYTPEEMFPSDTHPDHPRATATEEFADGPPSREYLIHREEFLREMDEKYGSREAFFEARSAALNDSEEALMAAMEAAEELQGADLSDDDRAALEAELAGHVEDFRAASATLMEHAIPPGMIGDPELDGASALHRKPSGLEMAMDIGAFALAVVPGGGVLPKLARGLASAYGLGKSAKTAYEMAQADYADTFGAHLKAAGVDPTDPDAVQAFAEGNTEFTRQAMQAAQIDTVLNFAIDQGIGKVSGAAAGRVKDALGLPKFVEKLTESFIQGALSDSVEQKPPPK